MIAHHPSSTLFPYTTLFRSCDEDDLYQAMDWLLPRQQAIEDALAARHLREGTLVLYDVSSAALEGRTCPLGEIGHARRSEEHTSELQSLRHLVCRLLLEKKK